MSELHGLKKLQEEQKKLEKLQELLERPGGAKEAEVFEAEAAG